MALQKRRQDNGAIQYWSSPVMCFKYCERALNNYVVHEEELKAIGQAKNVKKFWENERQTYKYFFSFSFEVHLRSCRLSKIILTTNQQRQLSFPMSAMMVYDVMWFRIGTKSSENISFSIIHERKWYPQPFPKRIITTNSPSALLFLSSPPYKKLFHKLQYHRIVIRQRTSLKENKIRYTLITPSRWKVIERKSLSNAFENDRWKFAESKLPCRGI